MEERTQEPGEGQGPGPLSKLTAVGGTQWQTLCPPAPVPPTPVSPPPVSHPTLVSTAQVSSWGVSPLYSEVSVPTTPAGSRVP